MGTELRFLRQLNISGFKDSVESQFWHGRALEMSLAFLPGDSPFVKHIIHSYQKHHSPSSQTIPEDYEMSPNIKVLKPLNGVHFNKLNPMIQDWDYIYDEGFSIDKFVKSQSKFEQCMLKHRKNAMIRITPLDMPANDYFKYIDERMKELEIKDIDEEPTSNDAKTKKFFNKNALLIDGEVEDSEASKTNITSQKKILQKKTKTEGSVNSSSFPHDIDVETVNITTSQNEIYEKRKITKECSVQTFSEVKPTKIYIDRWLSARSLGKDNSSSLKTSVEIAVNTIINFKNFPK